MNSSIKHVKKSMKVPHIERTLRLIQAYSNHGHLETPEMTCYGTPTKSGNATMDNSELFKQTVGNSSYNERSPYKIRSGDGVLSQVLRTYK